MGWGGAIPSKCACTPTWCYATDVSPCTCSRAWCYPTDVLPCTCTSTWCYARDVFPRTCTHVFDATLLDVYFPVRTYLMLSYWMFTCLCAHAWYYTTGCFLAYAHVLYATLVRTYLPVGVRLTSLRPGRVFCCLVMFAVFQFLHVFAPNFAYIYISLSLSLWTISTYMYMYIYSYVYMFLYIYTPGFGDEGQKDLCGNT